MSTRQLPLLSTEVPGPRSRQVIDELGQYESPAITARRRARAESGYADVPIVWQRAAGAIVEDVDGNRFLDCTAGFGVAGVGHSHPRVVERGSRQLAELSHAMGDAFPAAKKAELAKKLAEITPGPLRRSLFGSAGFEAVEAALKTALIRTGKPRVLVFDGAYHGLGLGALALTGYRDRFRAPFLSQLNPHVLREPYPYCYRCPYGLERSSCGLACLETLRRRLAHPASGMEGIGAIVVEPIQGRGGVVEAPGEWLRGLREIADERGIVLVADEIFTGFGRTGSWFAVERAAIRPDVLCVGKGMTGGFPISAAIGTDEVMDGWGDSAGEALHTSTFLGNPLGCEMALAAIEVLEELVPETVNARAERLRNGLERLCADEPLFGDVRGAGLMIGVELVRDRQTREPADREALVLCKRLLQRGVILLPAGIYGNVLSFTPPFVIAPEQIDFLLEALTTELAERKWA